MRAVGVLQTGPSDAGHVRLARLLVALAAAPIGAPGPGAGPPAHLPILCQWQSWRHALRICAIAQQPVLSC